MRDRLAGIACWISDQQLLFVAAGVAPVLLFDAWMPYWAIAAVLMVIPGLWLVRWASAGSPVRSTPLDVPILILLLMVPVGVWAGLFKPLTLPPLYRIVLGTALFYAAVSSLTSARRLWLVTGLLLAATPVLSLLALLGVQRPGGKLPFLSLWYDLVPASLQPFWRPEGFGSNSIAGGLAILLPLTFGFILAGRRRTVRLACVVASLFGAFALVFTGSRGAILGLTLAIVTVLVAWNRWFLLLTPIAVAGGLAALGFLGIGKVHEFLFSSTVTSAVSSLEGRLELWSRALYMIQDFPFTGVGLGMFNRVCDLLYPLFLSGPGGNIEHPHNIFLAQAVDSGLPGLIAYLALIFLLLAMALQSMRLSRLGEWQPLAIGLLGALAAHLAHGIFDSPTSFIRLHSILWVVFGLLVALWLHMRVQIPEAGHG